MKKYFVLYPTLLALSIIFCKPLSAQLSPVIGNIQGPTVVCTQSASAHTFSALATNSPAFYTWSFAGPSGGVVFSNPSGPVTNITFAYPTANVSYTLYCNATNGAGTSATSSFVVNVFETPTVTFSGNSSFCQGSGTAISASSTLFQASSTTISYNWSPATGLNTTTSPNVIASPPSTTNYTVLASTGTCTNVNYFTVTVNPLPLVFASVNPTSICQGQSANLVLSGSNFLSYFLDSSPVSTLTSLSPNNTTSYVVEADSGGCKSLPLIFTLTVHPLPIIQAVFNPSIICAGESSTLSLGGTATNYSVNSITASSLVVSPLVSTNYNVAGANNFGCSSAPQQIGLTVNVLPSIQVSYNSNVICQGESVSLGFSGTSVSYSVNGIPSAAITSVSPAASTNYTISGTHANSCTNSVTQAILVNTCVGLQENNRIHSVMEVFPNPSADGTIQIQSPKAQIVYIVNDLGQTLQTLHLDEESSMEVSGLRAGIYFVIGHDSKKKFVVTR